jgi:hypothetical protein
LDEGVGRLAFRNCHLSGEGISRRRPQELAGLKPAGKNKSDFKKRLSASYGAEGSKLQFFIEASPSIQWTTLEAMILAEYRSQALQAVFP